MSEQTPYTIRCPKCSAEQQVKLYDAIHVAQRPELKEALFKNELNRVQCNACDESFRVDKPLLYHDADRNILIHCIPDIACSRGEILDEFDESMEALRLTLPEDVEPPRVRLVFSRVELVELIFIIEAGMEERVIEHIKYTIYAQNMTRLPPEKKQLLLNVQDSTAEELLFAVRDLESSELEDLLGYPRETYRGVRKMYQENPDDFIERFPGPYINARTVLQEEVEIPKDDEES